MNRQTKTHTKEDIDPAIAAVLEPPCNLVVWNDDFNTFDWVIETLVDVCAHTEEQAEQCALIIHTKGQYAVKEGSYDNLKPMCEAITDRGINSTIEVLEA